jgi:hypothetical protein
MRQLENNHKTGELWTSIARAHPSQTARRMGHPQVQAHDAQPLTQEGGVKPPLQNAGGTQEHNAFEAQGKQESSRELREMAKSWLCPKVDDE